MMEQNPIYKSGTVFYPCFWTEGCFYLYWPSFGSKWCTEDTAGRTGSTLLDIKNILPKLSPNKKRPVQGVTAKSGQPRFQISAVQCMSKLCSKNADEDYFRGQHMRVPTKFGEETMEKETRSEIFENTSAQIALQIPLSYFQVSKQQLQWCEQYCALSSKKKLGTTNSMIEAKKFNLWR